MQLCVYTVAWKRRGGTEFEKSIFIRTQLENGTIIFEGDSNEMLFNKKTGIGCVESIVLNERFDDRVEKVVGIVG